MSLIANTLTCERNNIPLFHSACFELFPGDLAQVQGCNGAGKTSFLRVLCGLLQPTDGSVFWCRELISDSDGYSQSVLYIGHQLGLRDTLTVKEYFYHTLLHKTWHEDDILQALTYFQLASFINKPCALLSQGQRQRLALSRLTFSTETVWIIDEPFAHVDMPMIDTIESILKTHVARGGLVIIATHRAMSLNQHSRRIVLSPMLSMHVSSHRACHKIACTSGT